MTSFFFVLALCLFCFCDDKKKSEEQEEPLRTEEPLSSSEIPVDYECPEVTVPQPKGEAFFVGDGTPESCTESALKEALSSYTYIKFNCGSSETTIPLSSQILIENREVTYFIDGENKIRLDGQNQTRVIFMEYLTNLVLSNIVIENGYVRGTKYEDASGSGVFGGMDATTYVVNVTFRKNRSLVPEGHFTRAEAPQGEFYEQGGALSARGGEKSYLYVLNSKFLENEGIVGGGILNLLTDLTVVDSVFEKNYVHDVGGGLYSDGARGKTKPHGQLDGRLRVCRSVFKENEALVEGGGAYLFYYGNPHANPPGRDQVEVVGSQFEANKAKVGAGLKIGTGPGSLRFLSFIKNVATDSGAAFVAGEQSEVLIENSTFYQNRVTGGEGLAGVAGAILQKSTETVTLKNCSLIENSALKYGGAIYSYEGKFKIYNSLFYQNSTDEDWHNQCSETWEGASNLIYPRYEKDQSDCTKDPIVEDPLLKDGLEEKKGLKAMPVQAGSPAKSAGLKEHCLTQDQWLEARGESCTLGAVE